VIGRLRDGVDRQAQTTWLKGTKTTPRAITVLSSCVYKSMLVPSSGARKRAQLSARLPRHLLAPPKWGVDLPALTIVTVLVVCDGFGWIRWVSSVVVFLVLEVWVMEGSGRADESFLTPRARAGLPE
jgi:hypothetical protein